MFPVAGRIIEETIYPAFVVLLVFKKKKKPKIIRQYLFRLLYGVIISIIIVAIMASILTYFCWNYLLHILFHSHWHWSIWWYESFFHLFEAAQAPPPPRREIAQTEENKKIQELHPIKKKTWLAGKPTVWVDVSPLNGDSPASHVSFQKRGPQLLYHCPWKELSWGTPPHHPLWPCGLSLTWMVRCDLCWRCHWGQCHQSYQEMGNLRYKKKKAIRNNIYQILRVHGQCFRKKHISKKHKTVHTPKN